MPELYDPADPTTIDGQKEPYLASRKSPSGPVKVYSAIPHQIDIEKDGVELNAQYGDGVELVRVEGRGNGGNFLDLSEQSIAELWINGETDNRWSIDSAVFEPGEGPVNVKVVDPLSIPSGAFTIRFSDESGTGDLQRMTWTLSGGNLETPISSDQAVWLDNEQVIFELGLSLTLNYGYSPFELVTAPNGEETTAPNNGYLGFEVVYEDETNQWLGGLLDVDSDPESNWIKSGDLIVPDPLEGSKDFAEDDHFENYAPAEPGDDDRSLDEEQVFENIAGRTWAPFALASYDSSHHIPAFPISGAPTWRFAEDILRNAGLQNTPSVNIYITKDRSKWTRCAVLEANDNPLITQGGAQRGELRRALSVDKDGRNQLDPDVNIQEATFNGTQVLGDLANDLLQRDRDFLTNNLGFDESDLSQVSFGMGWFPGYAVDVETGERLNMAFAEDSWLGSERGDDLLWNPTSTLEEGLFNEIRFGGKHMVYVFRHNYDQAADIGANDVMPEYDGGTFAFERLTTFDPSATSNLLDPNNAEYLKYMSVMRAGAWAGYPMVAENNQLFGDQADGNDVLIKLRASKPYRPYASNNIQTNPASISAGATYFVFEGQVEVDIRVANDTGFTVLTAQTISTGETFTADGTSYSSLTSNVRLVETVNDGLPLYTFNTKDIAPTIDSKIGEDFLDEIKAVPNPYYAYSEYEEQRLDYLVKVINLPKTCRVTIYTVNGTLVRTFEKDDETVTSIDWDLKNQDNIPIASGVYLIHIDAPGLGERVIKWFGVLRPIDLNSF